MIPQEADVCESSFEGFSTCFDTALVRMHISPMEDGGLDGFANNRREGCAVSLSRSTLPEALSAGLQLGIDSILFSG